MSYVLIATVKETLEMVGAAVLLYGLLAYIPVILPDRAGDSGSPLWTDPGRVVVC